ncbi:hypothetical protein B0H65DRAFT_463227, partial [Neurospora tetraspora]
MRLVPCSGRCKKLTVILAIVCSCLPLRMLPLGFYTSKPNLHRTPRYPRVSKPFRLPLLTKPHKTPDISQVNKPKAHLI